MDVRRVTAWLNISMATSVSSGFTASFISYTQFSTRHRLISLHAAFVPLSILYLVRYTSSSTNILTRILCLLVLCQCYASQSLYGTYQYVFVLWWTIDSVLLWRDIDSLSITSRQTNDALLALIHHDSQFILSYTFLQFIGDLCVFPLCTYWTSGSAVCTRDNEPEIKQEWKVECMSTRQIAVPQVILMERRLARSNSTRMNAIRQFVPLLPSHRITERRDQSL